MAQLYFKYGAMGSSKTANALMARFNYEERGQETLLVKPRLDTRDGDHMVVSRIGLTYPCIYFDEMQQLSVMELQQNACVIVDEAQFLTREEVRYLTDLVDDWRDSAVKALEAIRELDPQAKANVRRMLRSLFSSGAGGAVRTVLSHLAGPAKHGDGER